MSVLQWIISIFVALVCAMAVGVFDSRREARRQLERWQDEKWSLHNEEIEAESSSPEFPELMFTTESLFGVEK